ncbi:unnamed protein product [Angiostrongylus costaricensis]|uniref:C3H1-type domain-containing protein n=1 Tax=Angiostrongylus costaricensis TaxID=334426 RepID=A0A0R3PJG8_ANGCS|nr:unnamed protein product [Angiostrongylus costaricensis]
MHIENVEKFTSWLITELTPIFDAEPGALAKYVLALLHKPNMSDEEMHAFSNSQLEAFLQGNTRKFVDKMFSVLKDGSYLPRREPSPIPEEVVKERVAKREEFKKKERETTETKPTREFGRSIDHSEERRKPPVEKARKDDVQPAVRNEKPVRKRISPPPADMVKRDARENVREVRESLRDPRRRSRSRSPRERRGRVGARRSPNERFRGERRRTRSRSGGRSRSSERRDRRSPRLDDRRKRRCRDYDEKGYCMQGDHCVFDHGPDPVVVDDSALEKMVKIPEKPTSHNFTIPPPGYHPPNPPPPGVEPLFAAPPPGSRSVEGYNPEAPSLSGPDFSMPPPPIPVPINTGAWRPSPYTVPATANVVVPTIGYDPSGGIPVDPSSAGAVTRPPMMRSGIRGRGRGGGITGRFHQISNNRGDGKTLQLRMCRAFLYDMTLHFKVKKIPPELNNIAKLNEHFAAFGSIVNMQVRFNGEVDAALITYASRHEAMSAYKSPQPVLNNRFIKVFFYNPDAIAGSAPGVEVVLLCHIQRSVLNSGVNVDKPTSDATPAQPPTVATIETSKFVNQELKEAQEKIAEARRKLTIAKDKQYSLYMVHKRQSELLQKLVDRQKVIVMKLRTEGDSMEPPEKKRHLGIVKKLMDKITSGKKEIYDLSTKLQSYSDNIVELEKVISSEQSKTRDEVEAKRGSATVVVKGVKAADVNKLVEQMKKYGDIMHTEVEQGDDPVVLLTFRSQEDADQAVADGCLFKGVVLDITCHRRLEGSTGNSPLSADKMLAGIAQSEVCHNLMMNREENSLLCQYSRILRGRCLEMLWTNVDLLPPFDMICMDLIRCDNEQPHCEEDQLCTIE